MSESDRRISTEELQQAIQRQITGLLENLRARLERGQEIRDTDIEKLNDLRENYRNSIETEDVGAKNLAELQDNIKEFFDEYDRRKREVAGESNKAINRETEEIISEQMGQGSNSGAKNTDAGNPDMN